MQKLPGGVWPTMITPFTSDSKEIDWSSLDALTNWFIASGCAGLFTVCLSSEMYELSPDERLHLAERVHRTTRGRLPVVAGGTFRDCGSLEQQAAFVRRMSSHCEAVVVIVNQLALEDEDDDVWLMRAKQLLEMTGDTPLGIYESPLPYHRTLTPQLIGWAASTGRFLFHKDTCQDGDVMKSKIEAAHGANPDFRFFTAKSVLTKFCLGAGGSGFSGIAANFFPWLFEWLCRHHANQPDTAARVQRFLTLADFTLRHKYPISAKVYHSLMRGLQMSPATRIQSPSLQTPLAECDVTKLQLMHSAMLRLTSSLGLGHLVTGGEIASSLQPRSMTVT